MKTKLLLAVALLAVASTAAVWLWSSPRSVDYTQPRQVIELMPSSTPEWIEIKHINADGKLVQTDVIYRNGETGSRFWRTDGTKSKETIRFQDGRERMYAEFAADGQQIVTGHMMRADGSTVWEASVDAASMVTLKAYWYNGTLFEVEKRKVGKPVADQTFYYRSGAKWQHFIGIHDGHSLPQLEEIWNENGTLQFQHFSGMNEASFDTVYRADGSMHFKQYWILRPRDWDAEGTPLAERRLLLKIEMYSDDGKRRTRDYTLDEFGWYVQRVLDRNADGSTIEYEMFYDGTVYRSTKTDAKGKVVETKRYGARDAFKITMPPELRSNFVNTLDPRKVWQDLEDHPEKR